MNPFTPDAAGSGVEIGGEALPVTPDDPRAPVHGSGRTLDSMSAVLCRIEQSMAGKKELSVGEIQAALGRRSYGPLLLVPGLAVVSPLSGIPTLPTIAACIVLLIAVQMLIGHDTIWMPRRLSAHTLSCTRLQGILAFLMPGARIADRFVKPRLAILTGWWGTKATALVCLLVAVTMPPLEILPFLNSIAGAIIVIYALGLTAHDGLLVLAGLAVTAATIAAGMLLF